MGSLFLYGIVQGVSIPPPSIANALSNYTVTAVPGLGTGAVIALTVTGVTGGHIFFAFVAAGAAAPDGAQIIAETDGDDEPALWSDSVELASIATWAAGPTSLIQGTTHDCYAVYRAPDLSLSDVRMTSFSTPDLPPTHAEVAAYAYGSSTAIISFVTDDPVGPCYGVFSTSATKPTPQQVREGKDHTGSAAAGAASRSFGSVGRKALWVTGLPAGTTLYAHTTQRDGLNQDAPVATSAAISTDASETVVFSAAMDGTLGAITNITSGTTKTEEASDPFGGADAVTVTDPPSGTSCFLQSPDINFSTGPNKYRCLLKKGAWAGASAFLRTRILDTNPAFANFVNLNTKAWSGTEFTNEVIRQIDDEWIMAYAEFTPSSDAVGKLDYRLTDNASNNSMSSGCAANHTVSFHKMKVSY